MGGFLGLAQGDLKLIALYHSRSRSSTKAAGSAMLEAKAARCPFQKPNSGKNLCFAGPKIPGRHERGNCEDQR